MENNSHIIQEGPRDPHIFKAIFTAGVPGSGKTTVVNMLTQSSGLKAVNFDDVYSFFRRRGEDHTNALGRTDKLSGTMLDTYVNGRLGLVIDKTAWDYKKVSELKKFLESLGYSTFMVYVNTNVEIAKQRAKARYSATGRFVDDEYIDKVFEKLNTNIGKYQSDFGDNFVVVDNSVSGNLKNTIEYAERKVRRFLKASPGKIAQDWINKTP